MMTYVTVYNFDCCSRKNALDFLTNVLKDLHCGDQSAGARERLM